MSDASRSAPCLPAYAYLRVSGRGQVDRDGFPRQREVTRRYANEHGMRVVEFFEEKAVAGRTEWSHRPAWLAMLKEIAANGVRTILVEKLDRLARDLMVQEGIIADLAKRGVTLISASEPDLNSDDPARVAMRQMFGVFGQYEKSMLVIKLRAARDRKRSESGKCEGRKFYGDEPGEAEVRDRIRRMRREGLTLQGICDALNAEGTKTRCGRRWLPMTIARIAAR